ncbi:Metallo-hydrolase/oxidoreductase [Lichtheimia hyalospora FSU 10163]|nr:Metallo-hydrolase/oxidoreductase [Lichtheimia hyalospora FSU 10163]
MAQRRLLQLGRKFTFPIIASGAALSLYQLSTMAQPTLVTRADKSTNRDHHNGNGFKNPWESAHQQTPFETIKMLFENKLGKAEAAITESSKPQTVEQMQWDIINTPSKAGDDAVVVTWIGHACALVQVNGFNVLFDPIFSDRCSPLSFAGPKRYTEPPCKLDQLPRIDAVIISHNHYDHLDGPTIKTLANQYPDATFYVPLGNKAWFNGTVKQEQVIEMDWWDHATLSLDASRALKITCTPCQHFSGRGLLDRNKTLWASWCVEGIQDGKRRGNVYFGGDTGYRSVPTGVGNKEYDEEYLDSLPHCPAFKEIGDKQGPFDLALIPIGAYSPRWFMSTIHCSPEDAVRVHEDVKSKRSIGIHWGTFVLTDEDVSEPPRRLRDAMKKRGHDEHDFSVLKLGETLIIPSVSPTN